MVGPSGARVAGLVALSLIIIIAAACRGAQTATMSDLAGVQQLKERFNADAGKPRIVLLLSPT